jgi:hypothetical protein
MTDLKKPTDISDAERECQMRAIPKPQFERQQREADAKGLKTQIAELREKIKEIAETDYDGPDREVSIMPSSHEAMWDRVDLRRMMEDALPALLDAAQRSISQAETLRIVKEQAEDAANRYEREISKYGSIHLRDGLRWILKTIGGD